MLTTHSQSVISTSLAFPSVTPISNLHTGKKGQGNLFHTKKSNFLRSRFTSEVDTYAMKKKLTSSTILAGSSNLQPAIVALNSPPGIPVVDKAIIVGGGIGGLITAIALRKVGVEVQVYERTEKRGNTTGTLISLWPNGLKALAAIEPELVDKLIERGAVIESTVSTNFDGVKLSETTVDWTEKYGQPFVCIRWSRILDTFQEFLPAECIHTGYTFTGNLSQEGENVTAVFEKNGEEITVQAPLLIGADGIRSKVRPFVLGDLNVEPRDNGRTIWRLVLPKDDIDFEMLQKRQTLLLFGPGRVVCFGDAGEGFTYLALTCADEYGGDLLRAPSQSQEESKEKLLRLFKDANFVSHVLESLDATRLIERRILDLPMVPFYFKGNVLLLGDAAHGLIPSLGQGANLTFEDALELANQIILQASITDALEEFSKWRLPRIASVVPQNESLTKLSKEKPGGLSNVMNQSVFFEMLYNYNRLDNKIEIGEKV